MNKGISKTILIFLALGGLTVTLAAFPGLGYVLKYFNKNQFEKFPHNRLTQSLKRLKKQELVLIKEEGDQLIIELTDKGKQKVLKYKFEEMELKKGKWDGKWRIVIFDIPEKKKEARNFLRSKMKELGFFTLQKSVLVTPWQCKDEIDFIKHFYEVGKDVKLIEARKFDGEEYARVYFNL